MVGYVFAVAVSLVTLAVGLALRSVFTGDDQGAAALNPVGLLVGFVGTVLLVVLVGAIPAAVIGAIGVLAVHVATLGARSQLWHVLAAGAVGYLTGWVLFLGDWPTPMWWIAPVATMTGRAAVIPRALERRAGLDHAAAKPA